MIFGEYSDIVENDIFFNATISRRLQIFVLRGLAGMGQGFQNTKWPAVPYSQKISQIEKIQRLGNKAKKSVKRQTDTKTQWNTLQVSLFYSFHVRKSKV